MKYIKYFENPAAVESGVEVDLPNVSYLEDSNVLFAPGNDGTATVKYNGTTGEIELKTPPNANGHEYVDLGLPSGNLWAKFNVGSKRANKVGYYFAWGETTGYVDTSTRDFSTWTDYAWGNSEDNMTKYNKSDGLTTLQISDDAARVVMGGDWCIPTLSDFQELLDNTTHSSSPSYMSEYSNTSHQYYGFTFVSKKDTTKFIQLYCYGYATDSIRYSSGNRNSTASNSSCAYWTSSLGQKPNYEYNASYLLGEANGINMKFYPGKMRCYGMPIRGILRQN